MDLKLSVLLSAIDRATKPLRSIMGSSTATSKALRETRQRLKELERAQKDIQGFRDLKAGTVALGSRLANTQARATKLAAAIKASGVATEQQSKRFEAAKRNAARLAEQYQASSLKLQGMRQKLADAGINTANLASHQRTLKQNVAQATQAMEAQKAQLQQLGQRQANMAAARQAFQRGQASAAHLSVGGFATMATGRHVIGAMSPVLDEAKAFQTQVSQLRALGMGDAMVSDAVKFAGGMDVMGSSVTENVKLLKEAYSVLRDMHEAEAVTPYLARMKFGIETVMAQGGHGDGHGANAETMFMDLLKVAELRGAANSPEKLKRVLDFATQAYVGSSGLVRSEDLLNMIKTGGVAAKQLDDSSFFFGLLHTVQEMGGHRTGTGLATAYQNWAAGRTTQQAAEELSQLGLLNKGSVKYGKTGHVTKLLPDALADGQLYRSNPFEFLMQKVVPKLNPDGSLSDQQVVSKINALFSGRKGGDLFASLFMERKTIGKYLDNVPKSYGVEALYGEAKGTAAGNEAELLAQKSNLYKELGTQLLPLYVSGLQKLVGVLRAVRTWSENHPKLAKGALVFAGSLGVVMTAAGGLMIAIGALMSQFTMLRFAGRMAFTGFSALFGGAGFMANMGRFIPALLGGARALLPVLAGLALPVIAFIAVITVLALVVRKYWEPIKAFFAGVGEGISNAVGPAFEEIGAALAPLKPAFDLVSNCVKKVWEWFTHLLEPMHATKEQLDGARTNGMAFGKVIGTVIGFVVRVVTFGAKAFVKFGVAIGEAAGWVVTHWEPVKAWFADMWSGIEDAARRTLDWISTKLQAVRDFIQTIRNFGNSSTPAVAGAPAMQWITGDDQAAARAAAAHIARFPAPASTTPMMAPTAPLKARSNATAPAPVINVYANGGTPGDVQREVQSALRNHQREQAARNRSAYNDED